jgi:cell division septum initiation protein DivIVA
MHNIIKQMQHDRSNRPGERYVPIAGKAIDEFIPNVLELEAENKELKKQLALAKDTIESQSGMISDLSEKVAELEKMKE